MDFLRIGHGMKLSDFDFDLPEDLIALRPATPRTAARKFSWISEGGGTDRDSNSTSRIETPDPGSFNEVIVSRKQIKYVKSNKVI